METRAAILVIYTGGTIGMFKDPETGSLRPFNFDELYNYMPSLELFKFKIDSYSFDPIIDSANINPDYWIKLVEVISENYEKYDGFVILHGTDTMSYTASALSFMLDNLNKPVVITGSQLPLGMIRTDGRDNFITSLEIAGAKSDDIPMIPEVCIYFENQLFRGNRTHKFNAENFDAFKSVNYPTLANVGVYIKYREQNILKPNFKRLKIHTKLDNNIVILRLFPGICPKTVNAILSIEGLKGVILETYGAGNAPTEKWFLEALKSALDAGILIVNISQCRGGSVEMGKYETSLDLANMGLINGKDMTMEAALTKLMLILGKDLSNKEAKRLMEKNLKGEIRED
ncbi:MAG: asparaginase [Bacteroidales bacterium]|jgi:L-asparaginase|nr:asparaginase [Bacteroidales bacterium]